MKKIFVFISAITLLAGGMTLLHSNALAEEQQKIVEKSKYSLIVRFRTIQDVELQTRYPQEEECNSDEETIVKQSIYSKDSGEVKWCRSTYEVDFPVMIEGTGDQEKDFELVKKEVEKKVQQENGFKGVNELPWVETHVVDTDYNNADQNIFEGVKRPEECEKYQVYDFYFKALYQSVGGES